MLDALCTTGCKSSLSSVRSTILSGCSAETDVVEYGRIVYPASYTIDRMIHAYDVSCAIDAASGLYCDEIYLDNLAKGTMADECSNCALGVGSILLSSPFGYDAGYAANFESQKASCGSAHEYTSPIPYAISTKPYPSPTGTPTCASPYIVKSSDTCNSIAAANGVSTHSVIRAGQAGPGCANLVVGKALCLPEACTLYEVQLNDRCTNILAAVPGLRAVDLLTWNPNINPLCSNIDSLVGDSICVSPNGRTLDEVIAVITAPVTSQPPATAVPRPSNAKAESAEQCAAWYEVQTGDFCQLISIANNIELQDFFFLNPSVDDPGCTNLWAETSYCVKAVGDINTYPSYPYSTSPLYTLSASDYVTTTRNPLQTVVPSAVARIIYPLAPGSHDEADGCLAFVQHRVVPVQRDQSQQVDVPSLTKVVNSCDYLSGAYDMLLEEFLTWNPSLDGLETCQLQPGYRYCVSHNDATVMEPSKGRCLDIIITPEAGTVDTCSCFTLLKGWDVGLYLCEDIVEGQKYTVSDLLAWNPWIGTKESDCDAGLYAGLESADERALCINGEGGSNTRPVSTSVQSLTTTQAATQTTSIAAATTTTAVAPPGPTRAGIVAGCLSYHLAVSGDGCWSIANAYAIALDDLYAWNPALNGDCSGLWLNYAYCLEGPAADDSDISTPPGPTRPGTIDTCKAWHLVVSGQGCWDIQQLYGIDDYATLLLWNPALGSNYEGLWADYAVCVGV